MCDIWPSFINIVLSVHITCCSPCKITQATHSEYMSSSSARSRFHFCIFKCASHSPLSVIYFVPVTFLVTYIHIYRFCNRLSPLLPSLHPRFVPLNSSCFYLRECAAARLLPCREKCVLFKSYIDIFIFYCLGYISLLI